MLVLALLAVATAFQAAPLSVAIPVVVLAAVLILRIKGNGKIKGDAAIALISTGALALGSHGDLDDDRDRTLDVLQLYVRQYPWHEWSGADVRLSVLLAGIVRVLDICLFYNKIFAVTFDETFRAGNGSGCRDLYNTLIAVLTAVTIVLGNADDGSSSDLQSDHLSGADVDACMQNISVCHYKFRRNICFMSCDRDCDFLCMGNSRRSKCCHRKCCGSSGVFYCRNDTMQKVTVPTASFVKPHGCFLWPVLLFYS